ncbi:MAG TPA: Hpt domain-containing protein [Thermoanaerobaculia bacterium]|nr:Hpt domain-containing protein [Thermoanaerobaculia bacterium]
MIDLRARFRENTHPRLIEMRAALDAADADSGALATLARHFHALSGMGGTYGFPRVSELGDEGELLLRNPDAAALSRCRELVDEIERELC